MLHDPVGHDAQRDIPCVIKGSIMFLFNFHVLWGEDDVGKRL